MFSKYQEDTQRVLLNSKIEAINLDSGYIGSVHVFLSLLKNDIEIRNLFLKYNITYNSFYELCKKVPKKNLCYSYSSHLKDIITASELIAKNSNVCVCNNHLIYSILDDNNETVEILEILDVDIDSLLEYFSNIITNYKKNTKKYYSLEYGIDLCEYVKQNKVDPVLGRDKEVLSIIEVLLRRCKNNPLLIGEAGVGKTSIIYEIARRIVNKEVPEKLCNKKIISISLSNLVSNTKYRGEFEEKVSKIIKETESNENIILFIDEIHQIMGAGGAEGAIDAANIFKPALTRGKLSLIGATTIDEYKKTIKKDKAMDRRFQIVNINELDNENVLNILYKLKPIYEDYHNVSIGYDKLKYILNKTNEYIKNQKQPDKSIDIIDLVCSKVSLLNYNDFNKYRKIKDDLIKLKFKKNKYILNDDYLNASKIKVLENKKLLNLKKYKNKMKKRNTVEFSDIDSVLSDLTNIPISHSIIESINIDKIKDYLSSNIFGQDNAINTLINITKRIKLKIDNKKPISLLFTGGTGVGKTDLVKLYSNILCGDNKLIRIDGSEYKDITSVNKLIGSNKGYVGYDDKNNILEHVIDNPYSVILFDEVEKAHPSVINLFLQILDEGFITDNKQEKIYFNNSIIIFTSNVGYNNLNLGFLSENINTYLNDYFSKEFLNRINIIVNFNKLEFEDIRKITINKLDKIKNKYEKVGYNIKFNDSVITKIISEIDYNIYGARKINDIISRIEDDYIIDKILIGKKDIIVNI